MDYKEQYKKQLYEIVNKLLDIRFFDMDSFIYNFRRMVNSITHFHNVVGKNTKTWKELSFIKFDIPISQKPKEGQVAYFYIENSYPKEIFNSHWCLIMKDLQNTMIVIPMTSIKKDARPVDKDTEMIIKVKDFCEAGCSKLKIHQMFSADLMRIDTKKNIYDLQTDFSFIKNRVFEILGK